MLNPHYRFPAGIGASCVLKTPWNGTLDRLVQSNNYSSSVNLRGKYFDKMCEESFKKGEPLSNYVPEPPHPLPPPEESEFDGKSGFLTSWWLCSMELCVTTLEAPDCLLTRASF